MWFFFFKKTLNLMQLNFSCVCVENEQAFAVHWWVPVSLGEIVLKRFPLQLSEANVSPQLSFCFSLSVSLCSLLPASKTH